MRNTLTSLVLGVAIPVVLYAGWTFTQPQTEALGAFGDPFVSIQLAPNPTNGDCLTTDGTGNVWDSCGAGGGSIDGTGTSSQLAFFTDSNTLSSVATGTLTTTATGLAFDATRGLVGGSAVLSLGAGYEIPTTTRMNTWDSAFVWGNHAVAGYDQVTTAGDGLTRTVNDFDCDTASGSVFGCLASADWTTFNGKLGSYDAFTHPNTTTFATTTAALSLPNSGFVGFMGNVAVDTSNYSLFGNTTLTLLNARSGASIGFRIANADVANFSTTGGYSFGSTYYNVDAGQNNMIVEGKLGVASSSPTRTLTVGGDVFFTYASSTGISGTNLNFTNATSTNLNLSTTLTFGGVSGTTWGAFCTSITGSATLCDGSDGGGASNWTYNGSRLTPSSTVGIGVFASSTIGDGSTTGGLTMYGNSTTTATSSVGALVVPGNTTNGTTTTYIYSRTSARGGSIVLEDSDGAGCTVITSLNGVLTAAIASACPTEY